MKTQIVHQFECYGNTSAPEKINAFLAEYPAYRVASIVPISISYAGDQTAPGVMVIFEKKA